MMELESLSGALFREDRVYWAMVQRFFERSSGVIERLQPKLPGAASMADACCLVDVESLEQGLKKGKLAGGYPLHYMLYRLGQKEYLSDTRIYLALHVCSHAQEFFKQKNLRPDQKPNRFEEACRAIRSMSDIELGCFNAPLPTTRMELRERLDRLTARNAGLPHSIHNRLVAIQTFLYFTPNYRARDSNTRERRTFDDREIANFANNDADAPLILEEVYKTRPEEERGLSPEAHHAAAGSKFESYSGVTVSKLNTTAPDSVNENARWLRAHQTALHRKRNNVIHSFRWDIPIQSELKTLLDLVMREPSDAGLAVILGLVTGRNEQEVLEACVSRNQHRTKRCRLFLDPSHLCWRAPIELPESRRKIRSEWRHYLEPGHDFVSMPLPEFVIELLFALEKTQGNRRLFLSSDLPAIKEKIKALISKVNELCAGRLTFLRISRCLFYTIAGSGDVADAALITSSLPPFGQAASAFYYRSTLAHLQTVYRRSVTRMFGFRQDSALFSQSEQQTLVDHWVGTELKLRIDLLKVLVSDLIGSVEKARAYSDLREFHNHLTNYCVMFLAFTTGHRSIRNPLENEQDIDWQRGFVIIDDKAGSGNRARIVPIVEAFREQLVAYLAFRKSVLEDYGKTSTSLFFYIEQDLSVEPVTPQSLAAHIHYAIDLPLNINRHFLRSELRRVGVSGLVVDYFMGHWDDGQEPFAHYSSLCPKSYRDELMGPLTEITERSGWKPISQLM